MHLAISLVALDGAACVRRAGELAANERRDLAEKVPYLSGTPATAPTS